MYPVFKTPLFQVPPGSTGLVDILYVQCISHKNPPFMKRNIAYMDPKDNAFIIFYLFQVLFRSSCSSINYQRMFLLRYPFSMSIEASNKKNMCECSERSSQLLILTTPTTRDSLRKVSKPNPTDWRYDGRGYQHLKVFFEGPKTRGGEGKLKAPMCLELWNFKFILSNILQPMVNLHHISQI